MISAGPVVLVRLPQIGSKFKVQLETTKDKSFNSL